MSNRSQMTSPRAEVRSAAGGGRSPRPALRLAAALLLAPLGGCGLNKVAGAPEVAYDYRERHPVVLAEAPYQIDLFPTGRGLDPETSLRLREFMASYRKFGRGQITMLTPRGPSGATRAQIDAMRRALEALGAGPSIYMGSYPVADPSLAAPIRLSFNGLRAKVVQPCGEWPDDLASGVLLEGWQNKTFYNFGCATQATLSAQVVDPRDIANPRGETPPDIETRMRAIGKVRQGVDPSTTWATKHGSISKVGGN
jgi:pilus assembly protein CpaD